MIMIQEFETYLLRMNRSRNTIRAYLSKMRNFESSGCDDFLDWVIASEANPQSVKLMIAAARCYADFSGQDRTELDRFKVPAIADPVPHPLPGGMDQGREILAHAIDSKDQILLALGLYAGLRVDESVNITREDYRDGYLNVRGKGAKIRRVPVSERLAMILDEHCPATGEMVGLRNAMARRRITNAAIRAGVFHADGSNISSHDLRATFATACYEKFNDVVVVQRLLGHAKVDQTQTYLGINNKRMENAVCL